MPITYDAPIGSEALSISALSDGEFELDGFAFGGENDSVIVQPGGFDPGTADWRVQDQDSPNGDGVVFGRDWLSGQTWGFTFLTNEYTAGDALNSLEAMAALWKGNASRSTPGAVSILRYGIGGRTRRVYGRPRRWSLAVTPDLWGGVAPVVADFQCEGALHYDDDLRTIDVGVVVGDGASSDVTTIRTNLCGNPNFETDTSWWTNSGATGTRDASAPIDGAASLKVTGGAAGAIINVSTPVVAGETYTLSADYKTVGTLTGSPNLALVMPGSLVTRFYLPKTQTTAGRFSVTATVIGSGNAQTALVSGDAADVIFFDNVLLERSATAGTYFDGSSLGGVWAGTPNASTSTQTTHSGGMSEPLSEPLSTIGGGARSGVIDVVGGTAPAPFIATIHGPMTNPWIAGPGWRFDFLTTLAYDQTLTVDTRPWAKTVLRNDGASLAGTLTRASTALSDARLLPGGGAWLTFGGIDGTGTATCSVSWRPTYRSL